MEYEKKFNVNDYYLKDVAYELKSHPDYIFRQELVINKPKHCDDYNVPFVNLLQLSNIPKQFFQQYELIKEKYNELNLNMNELINILIHIQTEPISDIDIFLMSLNLNNFNISEFRKLDIPNKIQRFINEYKSTYESKQEFLQLEYIQLSEPYISQKTFLITTIDNITLDELYNSLKVSNKFPYSSYYNYLKIYSDFDNDNLSQLVKKFNMNNKEQIILYYLQNTNKPGDINSYVPITINYKGNKCNVNITFSDFTWNTIKKDFYDLFENITFSKEKIISKEGTFFVIGNNINYSILSFICLNITNNFIIKNERTSIRGGYKLIYNLDGINITIKNNNITGSKEEQQIPLLSEQPQNTKYIEINFKSKNNRLSDGDISCVKKYVGKLLKMYDIKKNEIINLYNLVTTFKEDEDISVKEIVKTKGVKQIGSIINETIGNKTDLDWPRSCPGGKAQRQPKVNISPNNLIDISEIDPNFRDMIKQDIKGVYYMNWPIGSNYWFSCDHNVEKKIPSVMAQKKYFTPCCFKKLNAKNIRDYIKSTSSQIKSQVKFDKNTIILNLGTIGINISESQLINENSVKDTFKTEISIIKKKKNVYLTNIDKQSNLLGIEYNKLECISLTLEYMLNINIIVFDEFGLLLTPISTNFIGNIYYNNVYDKSRFFVRKNDKYVEIFPQNISENFLKSIINSKKFFKFNNFSTQFDFPNIKLFQSQYLDNYGKCRILKFKHLDIHCQTFIPPLPIPTNNELFDSDNLIPLSNIDDIKDSILVIEEQYIEDDVCIELSCKLYNFNVYVNVYIEPLDNIDVYDTRKIIHENTSVFETYSRLRKQSNLLKNDIVMNPTISDNDIRIIVNELRLNDSEFELVVSKLKFFRSLYTSKKSLQKTYIEPIKNISDYQSYPNQRIVNISHNILPKNSNLHILTEYNSPNFSNNPYFIKFKNNIYLVQDTRSISNSCYLQKYWNKFNINYKHGDKHSDCNNYVVYNYEQEVLVKEGNGDNIIIVINVNEDTQKFMTLLPL